MRRLRRLLLVAAGTLLAFSGQAFAHAHLKMSAPADKAEIAAPAELDLTFTEPLELAFSGVQLLGPDNGEIKLGAAMLMEGGKVLMTPVTAPLQAGRYTVKWHVLSTDGHKTEGSYGFTVKP